MHTAFKAQTQDDKPTVDEMWRSAKGNSVVTSVYSNMGNHIIKISAVVTGGGVGGTDKPLPGHSGNIGTVQFWSGKIEISTLEESNSPY